MSTFHTATFRLLHTKPRITNRCVAEIESTERRIGERLPLAVREWYSFDNSMEILLAHSNDDPPIPLDHMAIESWQSLKLLPFQTENQAACRWAVVLDGTDNPPVYVDIDSLGDNWQRESPTFSSHVHARVWDYTQVHAAPYRADAIAEPLSKHALDALRTKFAEAQQTFGWPGDVQYRFSSDRSAILLWQSSVQTDWHIGAQDEIAMESALRAIWSLDGIGELLDDVWGPGQRVLKRLRSE